MKYVAVNELKTHCSALLSRVANRREPIIVTKHGKPVARIVPIEPVPEQTENPLKNSVTFYGDIESPLEVEWDADKK